MGIYCTGLKFDDLQLPSQGEASKKMAYAREHEWRISNPITPKSKLERPAVSGPLTPSYFTTIVLPPTIIRRTPFSVIIPSLHLLNVFIPAPQDILSYEDFARLLSQQR